MTPSTPSLGAPSSGEVRFLKNFEEDFPELAFIDAKTTGEKRKPEVLFSLESAVSRPTEAFKPRIESSSTGSRSMANIHLILSKNFQTLQEINERQRALEMKLDATKASVDSAEPNVIAELEECLSARDQVESEINVNKTSLGIPSSQDLTKQPGFLPSSRFYESLGVAFSPVSIVSSGVGAPLSLATAAPVSGPGVPPSGISIKLVHEDREPLLHRRVEIYRKSWLTDEKIAYVMTNREGILSFPYDLEEHKSEELKLCVYEELLPEKSSLISRIGKAVRLVFELKFVPSPYPQTFTVDLYEYPEKNAKYLPRLRQPQDSRYRPQQESLSYIAALGAAGLGPKTLEQAAKLGATVHLLEQLLGVIRPELQLDSKTAVELLLRGIFPCNLLKAPPGSNAQYLVDLNWDRYSKDKAVLIPNVKILLKDHPVDCLQVCNIQIQFQGDMTYTDYPPNDVGFEKAVYIANSMALIKGEIVSHLGLGHLYTEQNAMAVFRTLRYNPLGLLLKPHLRGVMEINRRGDDLIFGENGILHITGLSLKGITLALQDVLSGSCYSNFSPRDPVNSLNKFAQAERLYWDILGNVVDEFFNAYDTNIKAYWYEIIAMSRCLNNYSLPHRRWEDKAYDQWVSINEIDQPELGEAIGPNGSRGGQAVRPIVRSPNIVADPEDFKRLKQFSRHAIFMATFWHWAVHSTQGDWGTNLKIAALAPRDFAQTPYRGVTSDDAAQQLSLAHTFVNFQRGHAVDNIHGDIYPVLIASLIQKKNDFSALGFNIDNMFGGVFI